MNLTRKILVSVIITSVLFAAGGCSNEQVEKAYYHDDDVFIRNHTSGIFEWESTEYEEVGMESLFSVGPHEPLYRGVIVLTDEYAQKISEEYEWEEIDFDPEFSQIDADGYQGPWRTSEQFSLDAAGSKYEPFEYLVFNGDVIMFSLRVR